MEMNKYKKEDNHEEELCSLSEIFSSFCSEDDRKELSPLQEIFGAHLSSRPKDVVTKNSEDERDKKRRRSVEYRVMMEKKRRRHIRDKLDILHEMTPNCGKADLATKLDDIAEYIKSLKRQINMMSMAYTANPDYTSLFYGAQAPCIPPMGYYAPKFPMMPYQNMPFVIAASSGLMKFDSI